MPNPSDPSAPQSESSRTAAGVHLPQLQPVAAGEFLMGTSGAQVLSLLQKEDWAKEWQDKNLFQMEQPQHRVTLSAYAIGLTPVTNAEYQVFVWESGHKVPKGWDGFRYPEELGEHPVVNVSLEDALAYCVWMSRETGKDVRLPTEAEWEKAARGSDGRMYPWGEEFDPWRCNTQESGKNGTTPVLSYHPAGDSPAGCTDMSGNVYEWTRSPLVPYPYVAPSPLLRPDPQTKYAVRGGAWYYSHKLARCPAREGMIPTTISPAVGFRLIVGS